MYKMLTNKGLLKMKNYCYTEGVIDFVNLISKVAVLRERRLNFASLSERIR